MTREIEKFYVGERVYYTGSTNRHEKVKNEPGTITNINYTNKNLQIRLDESESRVVDHVAHVPFWSLQVPEKEGRKEIEPMYP